MPRPDPRKPPESPVPREGETVDHLVGDWWLLQLKGGHRFSTDDLLCGWRAAAARPQARACLDLGCGVGTVGLFTLGLLDRAAAEGVPEVPSRDPSLDPASLVGVEAQDISAALATRAVAGNGLEGRVRILQGDLRDRDAVPERAGGYDLVTGSPPYFPLGTALVSPHPQRAACRMELRGSVADYALTARRHVANDGAFVVVMAAKDSRLEPACLDAGFHVVERLDAVFREGQDPLVAVLTCVPDIGQPTPSRRDDTLVIRRADGEVGERWTAVRRALGFVR